jgi:type IV secretory pathway VirB10-like protein
MHESATRLAGEVVEDLTAFIDAARGTDVPWADARIFQTPIRRNIKLAESSGFGQTVFDYAPRSNGALDYARLAVEVFGDDAVMPSMPDGRAGRAGERQSEPTVHSVKDATPSRRDAAVETDPTRSGSGADQTTASADDSSDGTGDTASQPASATEPTATDAFVTDETPTEPGPTTADTLPPSPLAAAQ